MKLDRLLGILTLLLQFDRITAPELARRFEVNRRTIGRDIQTLCQAGIPVITHQGAGGGIAIAEGYKLDKSLLTGDELSGMIAALKGLGSVTDKAGLAQIMDKLCAREDAIISLREPIVINLASHYRGQLTEKIELIKRAVLEARVIEFDYYYEKGQSHRRIEPCFVVFQWTSWYVFGFCQSRQDFRMFKLLRLWNLIISEERYEPREIPPKRRDFAQSFTDDFKLIALFEPSERYKLIEAYGLNCFKEMPEGLLLEVGFTNHGFLLSWLLGFGGKVKVLEPAFIVEGLKAAAEKILSKHG